MIEVADRITPRLEREMAGEAQVELLGSYSFPNNETPHPSVILQTRSKPEHRLGELYDDMDRKDDELSARVLKSEDAVTALPLRFEPGDESADAVAAAELCNSEFVDAQWRDPFTRHCLRGEMRGIAVSELVWRSKDGFAVPEVFDRPMWRFGFRRDRGHRLHVRRPRTGAAGALMSAPASKFVVTRCGSCDNPWGKGLYDLLYWRSFVTVHAWTWWAEGVERWVAPTATVEYSDNERNRDPGSQQEKALGLAKAIRSGNAIAMPEGLKASLIEAAQGGLTQYGQFIDKCNKAKSMMLFGEVNTSGDRPGVGAFASEKVTNAIRLERVRARVRIAVLAYKQIVVPTTVFNFGPDVAVPKPVIELEDATSLETRREGIRGAIDLGLDVPIRQVRAAFQVDRPRRGEEVINASNAPASITRSAAA